MQKAKQRLTSLVVACVMMIACLFAAIATLVMPQTTAVAATGNYVKVTEAPTDWSGKYLIVYEAGKVAFDGSLSTLDAVSNTIEVAITDGKIEANETTNAAQFTIAKSGTSYTIKSASGKYIDNTSNSNALTSSTSSLNNTIKLNNKDVDIISSGGAYLRFNAASNQNRFRYYKSSSYSGQKAIQLYKYEAGETPPTTDPSIKISLAENNFAYAQVGGMIDLVETHENFNETSTITWNSSNSTVATVENGVVTALTMGETIITARVGEVVSNEVAIKVYPKNDEVLSIATAIEVAKLAGTENSPYVYSAEGKIETTEYDEKYSNNTLTISDNTGTITIFGLKNAKKLVVGQTIKVTGLLTMFGTTAEFVGTTEAPMSFEIIEDDDTKNIRETVEGINASMSLSYQYTATTKEVEISAGTKDIDFTFGANGNAAHKETTNAINEYTETVGEYTLNLLNPSKVYKDCLDEKGNSCLKLGAKSAAGSFSFTVPSDVNEVKIAIAGYKDKTAKITVNGTTSTVSTLSNNGEYTVITVDTSTTKTVTLTTASDGYRAMLNTISFVVKAEATTETQTVFGAKSNFKIRCAVDDAILDFVDNAKVESFGIKITANGKSKTYNNTKFITGTDDRVYVVIDLGNIINDLDKLATKFTVEAFATVNGVTYYSNAKELSVADMVNTYYATYKENEASGIPTLYNYLKENGKIA